MRFSNRQCLIWKENLLKLIMSQEDKKMNLNCCYWNMKIINNNVNFINKKLKTLKNVILSALNMNNHLNKKSKVWKISLLIKKIR